MLGASWGKRCSLREGASPFFPHLPGSHSPSPNDSARWEARGNPNWGHRLAAHARLGLVRSRTAPCCAHPRAQSPASAGAAGPLRSGQPHNHKRSRSNIPQAAQGSPQALHLGAAHCPQAVPAAGVGPRPQGGFPSQPGKAQVGRGWGEGRRGLRGFQPGNKTERTNPASECAITCSGAGQAGLRGEALLRCRFSLGPNLQASKSRATAVARVGGPGWAWETRTRVCAHVEGVVWGEGPPEEAGPGVAEQVPPHSPATHPEI